MVLLHGADPAETHHDRAPKPLGVLAIWPQALIWWVAYFAGDVQFAQPCSELP